MMETIVALRELLGVGGDAATIILLFVFWKFDRRLLRLEIKLDGDI